MRYIYLTLIAFFFSASAFASLSPIAGSGNVCIGLTDTLTNTTPGGIWSSSNPTLASVGASSGIVTAHGVGSVTIIYTVGTNAVAKVVTINSLPNIYNVFGGGAYCAGTGGVHIGVDGSELGVSYLLYYGSSVTGYAIGTGDTTDFGTLTVGGVYTVLATNGITGCSNAMTGSASVTIIHWLHQWLQLQLLPAILYARVLLYFLLRYLLTVVQRQHTCGILTEPMWQPATRTTLFLRMGML